MAEPLELIKQCAGKVNKDGIPPWVSCGTRMHGSLLSLLQDLEDALQEHLKLSSDVLEGEIPLAFCYVRICVRAYTLSWLISTHKLPLAACGTMRGRKMSLLSCHDGVPVHMRSQAETLSRLTQEDEDAPREAFCDVRFDVRPDPNKVVKSFHCAYTGKVFCDFCCSDKNMYPLPYFEMDPSVAAPVKVCVFVYARV